MQLLPRAIETAHDAGIYDSTDEISLAMFCRDSGVFRQARTPRYMASRLITPLRQRAVDRQTALAQASRLAQADEVDGDYSGRLLWIGRHYLVQENLTADAVLDDRSMVAGSPILSVDVRIAYREGAGTIATL
jgi:hypothetical protein